MTTPEKDMADALVAATSIFSPALALDTDIKLGPPRAPLAAGSTASIWLQPYDRGQPQPFLNAAVDGSVFFSGVQVIIRSPADQYTAGIAKARKVRAALHLKQTSGYISWRALNSEPLYMGIDEVQQHRWSINLEAQWTGVSV